MESSWGWHPLFPTRPRRHPLTCSPHSKKLNAALKEAGHSGIAGGAATSPCGVCQRPIEVLKARARGAAGEEGGGAMVVLGCMHVQHDACFKLHCDQSKVRD